MTDKPTSPIYSLSSVDPHLHAGLDTALKNWGARNFSVRRKLGGKSGALVFLVDIETPAHAGQGVLKLSDGADLDGEAKLQEMAQRGSPALAGRTATVTHHYSSTDFSALLLTVVGGGLLEAETIATADRQRLNLGMQKVAESLLGEWNANVTFQTPVGPKKVMEAWLGERLAPDGRLAKAVMESLTGGLEAPGFRFGGLDYPNPIVWGDETTLGISSVASTAWGMLHGDLHGENILVNAANPISYYFIDFAHLKLNAPLFFDQAYLELSFLFSKRDTATPERWQAICSDLSKVTRPQDATFASSSDDEGILRTVGMLREPLEKWIDSKHPQRKEDLKKQMLLARVAAGLNYASKRAFSGDDERSRKLRFLFLLYAAEQARQFYVYCQIAIPTGCPVATPERQVPLPSNSQWRLAWNACEGFPTNYGTYILVIGPDFAAQAAHNLQTIARLPWSLVVDFDEAGPAGKPAKTSVPPMSKRRLVTQVYPHQAASVEVPSSVCWYFADSSAELLAAPQTPATWRHKTLPNLRKVVEQLHEATVPMPVFLVILGDQFDPAKLRHVFTTIEEAAGGDLQTVVVSDGGTEGPSRSLQIETDELITIQCSLSDFALGVHLMLGDDTGTSSVWVPVRHPENKRVSLEKLDDHEVARYSGQIRLVPASGSTFERPEEDGDVADFLKGNVITWHDLDLHRDVDRDASLEVATTLRTLLSGSPSESFAIEHSPGAGGTTMARRIAWGLRDEFPCVVIEAFTDSAIDDIDNLFRRTNLPVLIVAEATRVAGARREKLYDELKARNVRFVILDVRRRFKPRSNEVSVALNDPMPMTDAKRFLSVYEAKAPVPRRPMLRRLAQDADYSAHRSAFFFGLYAYETEFTGLDSYVAGLMDDLPEEGAARLAQLALITRYSQEKLPLAVFTAMLGLSTISRQRHPAQLLGDAAAKLIMFDGKGVSISHPLLAEEVLRRHLTPVNSDLPFAWKSNLANFCVNFISEVGSSSFRESREVQEILVDLFIERSDWNGLSEASQFSTLIQQMPTPESQRRVLEALCNEFPNNAHFLNHLGRHINLRQTGTFAEAEEKLKLAIDLEPNNELHHHGLGMVYRLEVRRQLEPYLELNETLRMRLDGVQLLVAKAEECFSNARKLNKTGKYPVVTPIQMIIDTFERLCNLSGSFNYQEFLLANNYVSEWCRSKIAVAETLMSRLVQLEANSEPSEYTLKCDARLEEIHGNFVSMVSGLSALLSRGDAAKPPIRRMLARAYLRQTSTAETVSTENFRRIAELMRENLRDDPDNGNDVRNWFRAYRMLPEFSLGEAIEIVTQWSLLSDSVDAAYYLFILHFMQSERGIHKSLTDSKRYLDIVKKSAPALLARKSFEWWAGDNLSRPCPLVHHSELGEWSKELDFFSGVGKLGRVVGRIDRIQSPQAGEISVGGMPAFFVPRSDFRTDTDLNAQVELFLGFSYEGLRAWRVRKLDQDFGRLPH